MNEDEDLKEFKTYMDEIFDKEKRKYLLKFGYDPDNLSEEDKENINWLCPIIIYSGYYEPNVYLTMLMKGI